MITLYIPAYSGHLALRAKYKLDPGLGAPKQAIALPA
jgi:hypothetical protein